MPWKSFGKSGDVASTLQLQDVVGVKASERLEVSENAAAAFRDFFLPNLILP